MGKYFKVCGVIKESEDLKKLNQIVDNCVALGIDVPDNDDVEQDYMGQIEQPIEYHEKAGNGFQLYRVYDY